MKIVSTKVHKETTAKIQTWAYQITRKSDHNVGHTVDIAERVQCRRRGRRCGDKEGKELCAEMQPDSGEPERPEERGNPDPRPLRLQKGVQAEVGDVLPLRSVRSKYHIVRILPSSTMVGFAGLVIGHRTYFS